MCFCSLTPTKAWARLVSGMSSEVKNVVESTWSIDGSSGHCVHPSGLHAYFDSRVTESGGIRCVGPFHAADNSAAQTLRHILELSVSLESRPTGSYVVWGAFVEQPKSSDMELVISGERCGWIPNLSMRSEAAFASRLEVDVVTELLDQEWSLSDSESVLHRSGLSFRFEEARQNRRHERELEVTCRADAVDRQLVYRPILDVTIKALFRNAFRIFRVYRDVPLDIGCRLRPSILEDARFLS